MKIAYLGNHGNKFSDATERHIASAFRVLGHEVIEFEEKKFNPSAIKASKPDLFLFHKGGSTLGIGPEFIVELLTQLTCTKVCWYFDKLYREREAWAELIIPFTDQFFLTDETWMRRHNYDNLHVLHQGIGQDDFSRGTVNEALKNEIVFLGTVYGERAQFVKSLKDVYGDRFNVVSSSFGRKLYDLCESTKIFVAPIYPQDNFYWSSRPYIIMGSGGFLIHPDLYGMHEEFTNDEIVFYKNGAELREKIDYYLAHDNEREKIRLAGYKKVTENYTYKHRVEQMLKTIYGK